MPSKIEKLLQEAMASKHIGVERLQSLTDIPTHFLDALLTSDFESLPAKPYVRGYIAKLSKALDLDEDELLALYENESLSSSGIKDELPSNRFALPKLSYKSFILPVLIAVVIIYIIVFAIRSRTPYLELISLPATSEAFEVSSPTISLEGRIKPGDTLFINGEKLAVDSAGRFEHEYLLEPELNTLVFEVKRFLGKEIRVTRQVFFRRIAVDLERDISTSSEEAIAEDDLVTSSEEVLE